MLYERSKKQQCKGLQEQRSKRPPPGRFPQRPGSALLRGFGKQASAGDRTELCTDVHALMNVPRECAYEEALLSKRIEFVKSLHNKLESDRSIAGQVTAAYSCLLDEVLTEVLQEVHREVKTGVAQHQKLEASEKPSDTPAGLSPTPLVVRGVKGAVDAFGQTAQHIMNEEVSCSNCGRRIAASRFAPHLEKCLGRGRNASRAGSRRNF